MMTAMRPVAMSAAPLEASSAAVPATIRPAISTAVTIASAMRTIGAPVGASTASSEPAAITASVASAALRALETRTRIGADAREILTRCIWITRRTGFPGQEYGVLFDDRFDGGTVGRHSRRHGFRRNVFDGLVVSEVGALGFGHLRAVFFRVRSLACFTVMLFVPGIGGELFFARLRFSFFPFFLLVLLFLGFFFAVAVFFALGYFVRFVESLGFVLVKIRATDKRVGFSARLSLFVLGFHKPGGERNRLFIAEGRSRVARWFG